MKIMTPLFLALTLFYTTTSYAIPWARVTRLKGTATYNGTTLTIGQKINTSGKLVTKKRSLIQIEVPNWNSTITLGPRSKMDLDFSEKPQAKPYVFIKGICRWASKALGGEKKGKVFSRNATFGIRGTDFILMANTLLGESEIIVFEGEVLFENSSNNIDQKVVKANQWGGLGGRFGSSIGEILTLPEKVIKVFKKKVPLN